MKTNEQLILIRRYCISRAMRAWGRGDKVAWNAWRHLAWVAWDRVAS